MCDGVSLVNVCFNVQATLPIVALACLVWAWDQRRRVGMVRGGEEGTGRTKQMTTLHQPVRTTTQESAGMQAQGLAWENPAAGTTAAV